MDFESMPFEDGAMETSLWEYIDGLCNDVDRIAIQKRIGENSIWQEKYNALLKIHQLIASTELEEPSLRFTKNVMEDISKYQIAPAAKNYINKKIIWGIAASFLIMILGSLAYGMGQVNWKEAGDSKSPIGLDLDKINYSKIFSNSFINIFMMLNLVLALMLFDRYLSNKKKKLISQL